MCENKFEQDREKHSGLVKITVAKHYVDPWYVKIYCNKNNDLKENVKLTKDSPRRMSQIAEKHEMCETVWPCGQTYPLPGLIIKSHKSSACQGRSRMAVHSHSE